MIVIPIHAQTGNNPYVRNNSSKLLANSAERGGARQIRRVNPPGIAADHTGHQYRRVCITPAVGHGVQHRLRRLAVQARDATG